MNILVKTTDLSRSEWLQWRTKGIGGSDVAAIAGISRFKSVYEVWMEKTGQTVPDEAQNDFTHFGSVLEPVVKREFMQRTGLKVRAKRAILQSSEYPFMLADLDGVIHENGKMCIFEAKTASAYKQDVWEAGVPEEYILQVQHYMAVTGAGKAYVAAIVGGNHFFCHEVFRDDVLIRQIIMIEKSFWDNNVLGGKEPLPDGSEAAASYLNEKYSRANGRTIELPEEMLALFEDYDRISGELEALKEQKEAVTNRLKSCLKENEAGTVGGRLVTWKQYTRTGFDQKRLKEEQPEIYGAYATKSSYRRLNVA